MHLRRRLTMLFVILVHWFTVISSQMVFPAFRRQRLPNCRSLWIRLGWSALLPTGPVRRGGFASDSWRRSLLTFYLMKTGVSFPVAQISAHTTTGSRKWLPPTVFLLAFLEQLLAILVVVWPDSKNFHVCEMWAQARWPIIWRHFCSLFALIASIQSQRICSFLLPMHRTLLRLIFSIEYSEFRWILHRERAVFSTIS